MKQVWFNSAKWLIGDSMMDRQRQTNGWLDGWMDGYFVYRRSTLKGHIASNKMNII